MKTIQKANLSDYIWLLILSAIWGSAFIGIGYALGGFHPFLVAFIRIFVASIMLLGVMWYHGLRFPRDGYSWKLLIILGFTNNAMPFFLISWGQQFISASTAAVMLAVGPFVALVMSHILTHDEKFSIYKLLGVAMGFTGVFILFGSDFLDGDLDSLYGKAALLIAVIGYITSGFIVRKLSHIPTAVCSTSMFATASVMMAPVLFWLPLAQLDFASSQFAAIIYLAIVPTALASLVRIDLVQKAGVQFMSQVSYLIPLFAILFSWILFDDIPEATIWIALFFILSGLFVRSRK